MKLGAAILGMLFAAVILQGIAYGERPNVVLIVTDDQGYGDLSCHGNPVLKTPNLDALHAESVRLTNFHVDPTCSPTRAALMSGCYSHRVNVWHTINGRNQLEPGRPTMAKVFRKAGYRTAHFGKWHLGGDYPFRPIDRGFDEWIGQGDGGTGTTACYWGNDRTNDHYFGRNAKGNEFVKRIDGYGPDVFFKGAIDFVRRNKARPFFVYLATYLPHSPLTLPSKTANDHYQELLDGNRRVKKPLASYFATIARIDENIGRLRTVLKEEGAAENTILIFMSDNGGTCGVDLFNAGMRGHKGSVLDGGHRVPCFMHWPASRLCRPRDISTLTAHIDLLPTLADLCRVTLPAGIELDGKSLRPLLEDRPGDWAERVLVVESQRIKVPEKYRQFAVMTDRWRLLGGRLYDMSEDPLQQRNVAKEFPDVVARLKSVYEEYWDTVTKNDSQYSRPLIGTDTPELALDAADLIDDWAAWHQGYVASGRHKATGFWPIKVVDAGQYRIELRRWPREADVPIGGVAEVHKKADAWLYNAPVKGLVYGGRLKAFPAREAQLALGQRTLNKSFDQDARSVVFETELASGPLDVRACFKDAKGRDVHTVYYVYIAKQENQ